MKRTNEQSNYGFGCDCCQIAPYDHISVKKRLERLQKQQKQITYYRLIEGGFRDYFYRTL